MTVMVFYNPILNPRTVILMVFLEHIKFLTNQTVLAEMKWHFWNSSDFHYIVSDLQSHLHRHVTEAFKMEKFFILGKNMAI